MKKWIVPLSMVLVGVTTVIGRLTFAQPSGINPFCDQDTSRMSAEKRQALQKNCDTLAKEIPPGPKPKGGRILLPPTPTEAQGGPLYGVIEGGPFPKWLHQSNYMRGNEWAGDKNIVYAGSLQTDPSQGVAFLATRFTGPVPEKLGRYLTAVKDGALRVESAKGIELTLIAKNGTKYRFNIEQGTLIRSSP
jgi:hypothetical protein